MDVKKKLLVSIFIGKIKGIPIWEYSVTYKVNLIMQQQNIQQSIKLKDAEL
jgi:hypothetical protein